MQEGLLSVAQTGDSDLLGGRAHRTANWARFYGQKTTLLAYYIRVTKWLVTCLQSNPIGTNFAGFCSNLGARGLFSSLAGFLLGAGNPKEFGIPRKTETQVPAACQPQPRQPHIIKLISQPQKPTRKISDTWIIDTGKRETRYRLVKIHQTIRQPPSVLAWRIPGMGEPGGLPSMGSHRVGHDWSDLAAAAGKILDARKLLWCTTNIEIMQDLGHLSLGHVPFIFILLLKWQIYGYIVLWLYRPILSFI